MPCRVPHLDEATTAAPGLSPGTITDEEFLLREVLNPDHVKNGEIQPSAIPLQDLKVRGYSLHRLHYVTRKFVEDSVLDKLSRPLTGKTRALEGIARFTARTVREIRDDGRQVFVVIDTAKPSNRGHASIYLSDIDMKDSRARSMREKLAPLLEARIPLAEAFSGE